MIQEILDYLLIKSHFILLSEEELLEKVKEEEYLEIYCDGICRILENETFLYTNPEFMKKLESIIINKRFEGRHSNELIIDLNEIVEAIGIYKRLTNAEKNEITKEWIKLESEDRKLPFRNILGSTLDIINECIKADSYYAKLLLQENDLIIQDAFYLMSTINMLTTRYPGVFIPKDDNNIELNNLLKCYASVEIFEDEIKKDKKPSFSKYILKNYTKTTKKNVERVMDNLEIQIPSYNNKILKKTKF